MRLLVVEDNTNLSALLVELLEDQAHAVDAVANVEDARSALAVATYHLVILDLALPGEDGGTLLRELRRRGDDVPVLVATARGEVPHRIATLDAGADDYIVKPFSHQELLARVRALLRRLPEALDPVIVAGNVALDTATCSLHIDGAAVELQRRESAVLEVLIRQYGRLVPRAMLEAAVYSSDAEVTPNAIEAAISRVRRRLESNRANVAITAMRGLGYILAGGTA